MTERSVLTGAGAEALRRSDDRIVITGAGGWIGLATLELLHNSLGAEAFRNRVHGFGSQARRLELRDGITVEQRPLAEIGTLNATPTTLLHTAFLTKDRAERMSEPDYVAANRDIRDTVFNALDPIGVDRLFLASSGAAGFASAPDASPAMRLYGQLKLDDEQLFAEWTQAQSRTAVIGRLFALSGPYINKHDTYALASFVLDAVAGRKIQVRAPHRVVRGYAAIREVMSLVFALLHDEPGVSHFETGGEAVELADIAAAVARSLGGPGVDRAPHTATIEDRYAGDDAAYQALLTRFGIRHVPFPQQVIETAELLSPERISKEAVSA